jgi:Coenzyme PQQ synthesis protein D (PqqD)
MMQDEKVFFVRPDDVVHDTIEGETVVIDLQTGVYFRLEGAAAHAWNIVEGRATEDAVIDGLQAIYAAPREAIARQVRAFLMALYRDGIIRREGAATAGSGGDAAETGPGMPDPVHAAPAAPFVGMPVDRFDHLRPLVGGTADGKLPFDGVVLHRFEDLDELLTIDPVHEVKDAGWPHREAAD